MDEQRPWAGRPALVTGAGGFIGSHLVEALARSGAEVRAFVRYNSRNDFGRLELVDRDVRNAVEVFTGDLTNPEAVAGAVAGCEVVFHLGALIPIPYSYRHPREFIDANIEGTLNVLEASRRFEVTRIVHTSTSEVYGTAQTVPINESHPLHPQSPYAASKVGADQLALSYVRSFGLPLVIARPFNTYGPRQSARAIVPTVAAQALTREVVELGSIAPTRDFLFVADTVRGLLACATAAGVEGETFNLGTGVEVSIGDVVDRIIRIVGREVEIVSSAERLRPAASEVERLVADTTLIRERTGWMPELDLDEGLAQTVDWIRGALDLFKPEIYNV